jgi:peptidoglycan/xylan/chitin deacetylase (PgdA/CDA1 family)
MEPILISDADLVEDMTDEELLIHTWRVEQLQRLGLRRILAETFAELVDWHEIAELVARGCKPELALEIAR